MCYQTLKGVEIILKSEVKEKKIFRASFNLLRKYSDNIHNATDETWKDIIDECGEIYIIDGLNSYEKRLLSDFLDAILKYLDTKQKEVNNCT